MEQPELSVVIPTLNAAASLPRCLDAVAAMAEIDLVVADGGSEDATVAIASGRGAGVVDAPRGRGPQLAAGAARARGRWLLFLHADTVLAPGWPDEVRRFIAEPTNADQAAVFRFALDDPRPAARRLERLVAWRSRVLGLPYGDQGLLIARTFYRRVGGFQDIPIMEDVDLVRRIGRPRLTVLKTAAVTSAARYRAGYLRRNLRNIACLSLYFAGLPPRAIARLYG